MVQVIDYFLKGTTFVFLDAAGERWSVDRICMCEIFFVAAILEGR